MFFTAVIKAADEYQDLLRISAASAGNDHRLGSNEAPPAIVSMFIGDELYETLEAVESGADYRGKETQPMEIGVTVLPHFPRDTTDRNRTSPFAFSGNKFEFRMLGSAFSVADPNVVLNTAAAESLRQFADILENSGNFTADLTLIIKKTFKEHKKIIFNGNNYSEEWTSEAARRKLSNLETVVDALPEFISKKSVELFKTHNVFSEKEIYSRYEILMENYCKTLHIEALTMIDIVNGIIIPACMSYQNELIALLEKKKTHGKFDVSLEEYLLGRLSDLSSQLLEKLLDLNGAVLKTAEKRDVLAQAEFYRGRVLSAMNELRSAADELEIITAKKYWPLPNYAELLYSVV